MSKKKKQYDPHEDLQKMGQEINKILNGGSGTYEDRKTGFVMLVFPIADPTRANMTTNVEISDAMQILKTQAAGITDEAKPKTAIEQ